MDCPEIPQINYGDFSQSFKSRLTRERVPISGTLELTYRCNVRCVHCYLESERQPGIQQGELTTAEVKRILDEVTDAGCLWFLFTGGEPLLRPDLFELMEYARRKGLLITLFTNGTMLNEERVARLVDYPPFYVEITLYGLTQPTYERVTGIPGSHARVMRGIELLKANGVPFKLKTMVMTLNAHELDGMIAFAEELGVGFRLDPMLNTCLDGSRSPLDFRLTPEAVLAIDQADDRRVQEWRSFLQRFQGAHLDPDKLYNCGAGVNSFHIDPYGQLSLCMMSRKPAYDLRTGSFQGGWDFLGQARSQPAPARTRCSTCRLKSICGQCPGWEGLEHGETSGPIEYLCRIAHLRDKAFGNGAYRPISSD